MKVLSFGAGIAVGLLAASFSGQSGPKSQTQKPSVPELQRLYDEDQADRTPAQGKQIDWKVVTPRDEARRKRVFEIYRQDKLSNGADYCLAAMVLQHGNEPEDFLLSHEFCVVAISKGYSNAKWLAVASEDRYLMNIGRPQRFATQYRADPPDNKFHLYEVDKGVTDKLRKEMSAPTLAEAQKRLAEMEKLFGKPPQVMNPRK